MEQGVARSKKMNENTLFRVIAEWPEPVVTIGEIAEEAGVSRQTVYNHIDAVEELESIHSKTIGQSTVYWHEEEEYGSLDLDFGSDIGISPVDQLLLEKRVKWRFAKQKVFTEPEEHDNVELRAWFWQRTNEYLQLSELQNVISINREESEDSDEVVYDLNTESMYAKRYPGDIEHYAFDHHFFNSSWFGPVRGIEGLTKFKVKKERRLKELAAGKDYSPGDEHLDEDVEFDASEITRQDYDEIYPGMSDILAVGEAVDHLVAETFNFRW